MDSLAYNIPTKRLFTLQDRTILGIIIPQFTISQAKITKVTGGLGGVGTPLSQPNFTLILSLLSRQLRSSGVELNEHQIFAAIETALAFL